MCGRHADTSPSFECNYLHSPLGTWGPQGGQQCVGRASRWERRLWRWLQELHALCRGKGGARRRVWMLAAELHTPAALTFHISEIPKTKIVLHDGRSGPSTPLPVEACCSQPSNCHPHSRSERHTPHCHLPTSALHALHSAPLVLVAFGQVDMATLQPCRAARRLEAVAVPEAARLPNSRVALAGPQLVLRLPFRRQLRKERLEAVALLPVPALASLVSRLAVRLLPGSIRVVQGAMSKPNISR